MYPTRKAECMRRKEGGPESGEEPLSEKELRERLSHFQSTHEISAIRPLIRNELPAIKKLAQYSLKSTQSTIVYDDLIGAGLLGFVSACSRYSPEKGADFQEHAGAYIKRSMNKELERFILTRRPRNILGMFRGIKTRRCRNCPRRCFFL